MGELMCERALRAQMGSTTAARPRRKVFRAASLIMVFLGSQGCFSYYAAEPSTLYPGEQVRVVLENSGADRRLAPAAQRVRRTVEGDFVGVNADSLSLAVWIGQAYSGTPFRNAHQILAIGRDEMEKVERRQLSLARTILTTAAVLTGVAVATQQVSFLGQKKSGNDTDPPIPPTEAIAQVRLPLSRLLGALLR